MATIARAKFVCALAGSVLLAALAAGPAAPAQQAEAAPPSEVPGAVGDVAGQVPAQHRHALAAPTTGTQASGARAGNDWWAPGDGRRLGQRVEYRNGSGRLALLNTSGPIDTKGHPFFTPLGSNGRACVTCHQPADGMSISVDTIRAQWERTGGKDPLFAAVDGSNCPSLPQGERASHSLLLDRGLFRIFLPWPPRAADGTPIEPEFTIEVVRDPTGCNLDPVYGLKSANPMVSIFRRPRPVANMKYLLALPSGVPPHEYFFYNDKSLLPRDPETGRFVSLQLLSDGRQPTLKTQAVDATLNHLQAHGRPTQEQLRQIVEFEQQVFAAQVHDNRAGALTGPGAPPGLGPEILAKGDAGFLANNQQNKIFGTFLMWLEALVPDRETAAQKAQREDRQSVARGADVFMRKRFLIRDVGEYNNKGLSNPFKRSCASGCHNTLLAGMDLAPGFMDLGTNTFPDNSRPDLPMFRIVCKPTARPHAFKGRVIYTTDPGRGLITGKCADVGSTMTQQSRALAARPPYFANGSAGTIGEMVDFYDRRFNIGYTDQEKRDLVAFLGTL
ncbi:hypothetical protein [Phenylobacterium sp.]|jgi:hypothetical protein|uniref:hypothetical protein n=1 Tax=Phenylobacterium sp. TaxID=1871053 RepID=UPI0037838FFC